MMFAQVDHFFVVVHRAPPPDDAEWDEYLAALRKDAPKGIFVYSDGGGPNAGQRRRLQDVLAAIGGPKVAVLSPSAVVRGIVTALNYFSPKPMKVFAQDEVSAGMNYIGADAGSAQKLLEHSVRLAGVLGVDAEHLRAA